MTLAVGLPDRSVLRSLQLLMLDNGIDWALIGGLAVCVHGQPRGTDDVDVIVDAFPPAGRLIDADYMRRFGFYRAKSHTGGSLIIDHRRGQVELLLADNRARRHALLTAGEHDVLGVQVPVIAPDALIWLKVQAMLANRKRAPKDAPDILSVGLTAKPNLRGVARKMTTEEREILHKILGAARE